MAAWGIVISLMIAGGAIVIGIFIIATGQLMLAVREIALNTRKQEMRETYRILETFANVWTILGASVAGLGIIFGLLGIVGSFGAS